MGSDDRLFTDNSPFFKFVSLCLDMIEKPVIWVRENIVVPNRREYYWYHEKIRRVPTVDECYTDDAVCIYEADEQFKLDKKVDLNILHILKRRYIHCTLDNKNDKELCDSLKETWHNAIDNYFIKYGDLGFQQLSIGCLMKQKHRMAWERRHGPVGTGRKDDRKKPELDDDDDEDEA